MMTFIVFFRFKSRFKMSKNIRILLFRLTLYHIIVSFEPYKQSIAEYLLNNP